LDQVKLTGQDVVTVNFPRFDRLDGIKAKVVRANQGPGGRDRMDTIDLTVEIQPHSSFRRTIAEGLSVIDAISAMMVESFEELIAEPIIITTALGTTIIPATQAEAITVPDDVTSDAPVSPLVEDTLSLADALTFGLDFYASRDTISLGDLVQEVGVGGWGSGAWGASQWGSPSSILDTRTDAPGITDAQTVAIEIARAETPGVADAITFVFLGTGYGAKSWGAMQWGA